jgi:hypothetical protein
MDEGLFIRLKCQPVHFSQCSHIVKFKNLFGDILTERLTTEFIIFLESRQSILMYFMSDQSGQQTVILWCPKIGGLAMRKQRLDAFNM